ncbi:MAG: HK97 gp10 family phage protein [Clostridia bacterium]|nr:HK97 gp10 family phage protein [Clostridia bacterium]
MTGLSSLLSRLAALPGRAQAALTKAAVESAQAAAAAARSNAPVRTGALRASIAAAPDGPGAKAAAGVPYAGYVEQHAPYFAHALDSSDYAARAARALQEGLR